MINLATEFDLDQNAEEQSQHLHIGTYYFRAFRFQLAEMGTSVDAAESRSSLQARQNVKLCQYETLSVDELSIILQ